ncbi:GDSL esterase/lipase At1g71691 [Diospyros lotus]|uniref:GDSL esterase/lipase At1g71691 n=1 Tax=Diospyros lotus TaxID=55363 RepID=UPI0022537C3F|nr:GDSL esterase/lipase At1g71691 [Diospyros lotus]
MVHEIVRFCFLGILVMQNAVSGTHHHHMSLQQEAASPSPSPSPAPSRKVVPAMFIFGDSLIDNGNNNNIASFAKANYFPYGIDFQGGPTGRFSNGFTMVDTIAQLLGLRLIPAYSEASPAQVLHGVNYASAAAGILDDTGMNFLGRIPFNQQIKNFEDTLHQITTEDRVPAAVLARDLAGSIFFVGIGSNDYLNNYLMPNYETSKQYNPKKFARLLTEQYSQQLTRLYNLGARKFVLTGIGKMGCIPSMLARTANGSCFEEVNQLVQPFNANVKAMADGLTSCLADSQFIFMDVRNIFEDIVAKKDSYGFRVTNYGCCGIGRFGGQITCLPFQMPCANRKQYMFWDAFHPTEAVNILMGIKAFNGSIHEVYPMNIEQLAAI